jgi:hypothetical protein
MRLPVMAVEGDTRQSEPLAVGPSGKFEHAIGTLMAGASLFIAAVSLARMGFGFVTPVPGQEPLALAPFVILFVGFGTLGLFMRLRQTSIAYADGWVPPRKTLRQPRNHRPFIKWQDIDHARLGPGPSGMTVHLRTGQSFRVKLKEIGPDVYREIGRRIPIVPAGRERLP